MAETWPRLSEELLHERRPDRCQACGHDGSESPLAAWQEHDGADKPEPIALVLCGECSEALVGPHPRLYRRMEIAAGEPFRGAMPTCLACAHRDGLSCRSKLLKAEGGPGLPLRFPPPGQAISCSRGKGGGCRHVTLYQGPVVCAGREEKP